MRLIRCFFSRVNFFSSYYSFSRDAASLNASHLLANTLVQCAAVVGKGQMAEWAEGGGWSKQTIAVDGLAMTKSGRPYISLPEFHLLHHTIRREPRTLRLGWCGRWFWFGLVSRVFCRCCCCVSNLIGGSFCVRNDG